MQDLGACVQSSTGTINDQSAGTPEQSAATSRTRRSFGGRLKGERL